MLRHDYGKKGRQLWVFLVGDLVWDLGLYFRESRESFACVLGSLLVIQGRKSEIIKMPLFFSGRHLKLKKVPLFHPFF